MLSQHRRSGNPVIRALTIAALVLLAGGSLRVCDVIAVSDRGEHVITPGHGIGKAVLGISEEDISQLFPYNSRRDQKWTDDCGDAYNWIGDEHEKLLFRFQNGRLTQVEARSRSFHTAESLNLDSGLSDVRKEYPNLRAYKLLAPVDIAQGNQPLIFWIDKLRGVAFALAYGTDTKKRYLYYIIVFPAGTMFCPEGELIDDGKWVEVPIDRSLKSGS